MFAFDTSGHVTWPWSGFLHHSLGKWRAVWGCGPARQKLHRHRRLSADTDHHDWGAWPGKQEKKNIVTDLRTVCLHFGLGFIHHLSIVFTLTGQECCSFLTVKLAVCNSSTCLKRKQSLQQSNSTWNNMHKQSPSRTGELGPVYLLCQSKAARSCSLTKESRSVCQPLGLSVNRPRLATKMAPHSEARWFTRLICFSCKL